MILEGGNIYNHSGLSRNWLHQDMLPGNVQMRRQVVYNATGYHYQEGCQFILVDHGGGCLIVNGDAYSLEAGSCCLLFVHHFYSIKPSQSVPLTLLSCLFSYSTYTFLTTISQFDFLSIDVPSPPNFANFSPQEMVHIQRIVAALSKPGIGANGKSIQLKYHEGWELLKTKAYDAIPHGLVRIRASREAFERSNEEE